MSRNLRVFVFVALVLWTVGAMNDAPIMYVLAGVSAAVILVAFLLSQLSLSRLVLEMTPPSGQTRAGAPIRVGVRVRSTGSITVGSTQVEVAGRNLTVAGADMARRVLLPPLPPGAELDVSIELVPPARGRYELGPPALIDSDPIGMFRRQRQRGQPFELIVFPRTYDVPRVAAWDEGFGRYAVRGRQARRDQGEFRGIREHTPGDDLRHVHWKVTAHVGELAVREYEPMRHDLISVHLDLAAANHYGRGPLSTLETAISAAASIARAGLAEQRSVAVCGEGLPADIGRAGLGQPHMQRIMVALAQAGTVDQGSFAGSLSRQLRAVPRGATVFVITTAAEEAIARALTGGTGAAGAVTLLVVEGELEAASERFLLVPRRVAEAALATGITVATLRSPADITEALTLACARRAAVGAG
ncbi:MAG: DUF58 domain-containing protein [Armatimonadota bacterium]